MRGARATAALLALLSVPAAAAEPAPRVGAVIVVDQMRREYLEPEAPRRGGLGRLAAEGAVFLKARHAHLPTETCPGHAALSTGRPPSVHGIVANHWHDSAAGRAVYCVEDPLYGTSPGRLEGPTLADAFKAAVPGGRVFSISLKDRGAVVMGGRRADLALWLDKKTGAFTTSAYYRRPAWLDAFNGRLKASGRFPAGPGGVPVAALAGPEADEATAELVAELVAREGVGRGPGRDLLFVSFSATDLVGHSLGTQGEPMRRQLERLDAALGRLLSVLEKAAGGSLVAGFSSDHGSVPEPEGPAGRALGIRRLGWDAYAAALEAALQAGRPAPGRRWISAFQFPHIYLDRALARERGLDRPALAREAAAALSRVDGSSRAFVPADLGPGPGADPVEEAARRSARLDRSGDVFLVQAPDVLLEDRAPGTSHGSPWPYDAEVPMLFWGEGVRRGRIESSATTLDFAPTMARLLGLDYAPAEGASVRSEALAAP